MCQVRKSGDEIFEACGGRFKFLLYETNEKIINMGDLWYICSSNNDRKIISYSNYNSNKSSYNNNYNSNNYNTNTYCSFPSDSTANSIGEFIYNPERYYFFSLF